jgi:hypothetical protein
MRAALLSLALCLSMVIAVLLYQTRRAIHETRVSVCIVDLLLTGGVDDNGDARYKPERAREVCEFKM